MMNLVVNHSHNTKKLNKKNRNKVQVLMNQAVVNQVKNQIYLI